MCLQVSYLSSLSFASSQVKWKPRYYKNYGFKPWTHLTCQHMATILSPWVIFIIRDIWNPFSLSVRAKMLARATHFGSCTVTRPLGSTIIRQLVNSGFIIRWAELSRVQGEEHSDCPWGPQAAILSTKCPIKTRRWGGSWERRAVCYQSAQCLGPLLPEMTPPAVFCWSFIHNQDPIEPSSHIEPTLCWVLWKCPHGNFTPCCQAGSPFCRWGTSHMESPVPDSGPRRLDSRFLIPKLYITLFSTDGSLQCK